MNKVICFEGCDGVGKDTIINQLIKDYPDRFFTLAFPTPVFKDVIKMWYAQMSSDNIDHVVVKNNLFLADFLTYQPFLRKAKVYTKTLLLNRYFLSSLAYARCDYDTLTNDNEVWQQMKINTYYPFLNTLVIPDLTILLNGDFMANVKEKEDTNYTKQQLYEINRNYSEELRLYNLHREEQKLPVINAAYTPALNDYTYRNVLTLLRDQGIFD